MDSEYHPPFTVSPSIVSLVGEIGETLGQLKAQLAQSPDLRLRRINRIRTIRGSLAIEGNTLNEEMITAILDGKRVIAPPREIQEVRNANAAYDRLSDWNPEREEDLREANGILMKDLMIDAGTYRKGGVGVIGPGGEVIHMAPPAKMVPGQMADLFDWLAQSHHHPLITSSAFHYEFEFIHPFNDGNGRTGRLWQTLILKTWNPLFEDIPVESLVFESQDDYYQAIEESTSLGDSEPFILFILHRILEAMKTISPQVAPQVTPQVAEMLTILVGEMGRDELQKSLGLKDRKSFRDRYLKPALEIGLIEMTIPDKPTSRLQKYRRK